MTRRRKRQATVRVAVDPSTLDAAERGLKAGVADACPLNADQEFARGFAARIGAAFGPHASSVVVVAAVGSKSKR